MSEVAPTDPLTPSGLPKLGFTTKEAAEILGFGHEDSVLRLIHKGRITPIAEFSRPYIITLDELKRFCRENDGGKKKRGRAG